MIDRMDEQYIQTVLESRLVMTNMLRVMAEQERTMAHMRSVNHTQSQSTSSPSQNTISNILQTLLTRIPVTQAHSHTADRPPTQVEIQSATRVVTYGEIENPINNECPISHEPFENNDDVTQICHCGHIFHTEGIRQWFRSGHQCPVCRHDIRNHSTQENIIFEYMFAYPPPS